MSNLRFKEIKKGIFLVQKEIPTRHHINLLLPIATIEKSKDAPKIEFINDISLSDEEKKLIQSKSFNL